MNRWITLREVIIPIRSFESGRFRRQRDTGISSVTYNPRWFKGGTSALTKTPSSPAVAVTLGDPAGIGAELVAKLLARSDVTDQATVVLVALAGALVIGLATALHDRANELQTGIHEGGRRPVRFERQSVRQRLRQALLHGHWQVEAVLDVMFLT